eukprot:304955_1
MNIFEVTDNYNYASMITSLFHTEPILNIKTIRNGMVPISITNFADLFPDDHTSSFCRVLLQYRFIFNMSQINQENYRNYEWESKYFDIDDIWYLKCPLFSSSYNLEIKLQIIDDIWSTDTQCSQSHIVEISPIEFDTKYEIDDMVVCKNLCQSGNILEFMPNDMIKVKTENNEIIITELCDAGLYGIYSWLVIEITNRNKIFYDLVLNTG